MSKISQIVTKNAGASALLGGGAPVVSLSGNPAIYYVNIDATSGDVLEISLIFSGNQKWNFLTKNEDFELSN